MSTTRATASQRAEAIDPPSVASRLLEGLNLAQPPSLVERLRLTPLSLSGPSRTVTDILARARSIDPPSVATRLLAGRTLAQPSSVVELASLSALFGPSPALAAILSVARGDRPSGA